MDLKLPGESRGENYSDIWGRSLYSLRGGYMEDFIAIGVIKGDTRSLDYSTYGALRST